ncbi:hypothetical protein FC72_GL001034 [Companilactobacillus tucceti DSM 20183]|uniref:S-layer protein C-terminal domain-containing protein n=1 Tax=Companilactobacillus tucceti DSM 20183 TaxID=1423811 RepID=A0A0R1IYK9_9LACO|nr:SLAP domain-containing protein [Companilactobacillus tucceti]KRK63903.1 hypothetical protein FC72_GL001034 [Companilactobacillus tucceti DSM 20183]
MNKKTLGSLFVAGMAAITVGIFSNSTDVSASGVATTFDHITRMYNRDGDLITNRALGANTPWQVGIFATINGEKMYQVSTNEFVKASETTYEGPVVKSVTEDDIRNTNWINADTKYHFYSDYMSISGKNISQVGLYSISSIKGNQITIVFNSSDSNGWIQTFTYDGNSLTSNSTNMVLYKADY